MRIGRATGGLTLELLNPRDALLGVAFLASGHGERCGTVLWEELQKGLALASPNRTTKTATRWWPLAEWVTHMRTQGQAR